MSKYLTKAEEAFVELYALRDSPCKPPIGTDPRAFGLPIAKKKGSNEGEVGNIWCSELSGSGERRAKRLFSLSPRCFSSVVPNTPHETTTQ